MDRKSAICNISYPHCIKNELSYSFFFNITYIFNVDSVNLFASAGYSLCVDKIVSQQDQITVCILKKVNIYSILLYSFNV